MAIYLEIEGYPNTRMEIEFPEVVESEVCLNLGWALMPFMDDAKGFQFIKEFKTVTGNSPEGLNNVQQDFVKYLYAIRKANREGTPLAYSWFKNPREYVQRDRVFVAGTIFPVMSIAYSGDAAICSRSKMEIKTRTITELRLLFGEDFHQYKAYSLEYISIDDDKICVYVPKFSVIGMDYARLLLDFLTNGSQTQTAANHGEFPDLETYELATEKKTLSKGCCSLLIVLTKMKLGKMRVCIL